MKQEPHQIVPKEIPLERIFRKIMHRKMTALERTYFRMKPVLKASRKPI